MIRRIEHWMKDNGKSWEHAALRLEGNGLKLDSAKRKIRRLRRLNGKPCPCLLMDIADALEMPHELLFTKEPYEKPIVEPFPQAAEPKPD